MYANNNDSSMATVCEQPRKASAHGLAQFADSSRPVVADSAQHGAGVAYSPQPPTGQGQRASDGQTYVAGLRSSGRRDCRQDSVAGKTERLGAMDPESRDSRESLHPQGQAPVVERSAPQGPVSVENVLHLLEYQQYRCALTGRELTPQTAALDHIVPIRFGGEHIIENAQVLHKDVNRAKGSLTSEEFISMCGEVVRWSDASITRKDSQ